MFPALQGAFRLSAITNLGRRPSKRRSGKAERLHHVVGGFRDRRGVADGKGVEPARILRVNVGDTSRSRRQAVLSASARTRRSGSGRATALPARPYKL